MIPFHFKKIALSLFLLTISTSIYSQFEKTQALYIYNFMKLINWPDNMKQGNFVVGILGKSKITNELSKVVSNKKVGIQNILIKEITDINQASACHLFFIPSGKSHQLAKVIEVLSGGNTLVVTESPGMAKKGPELT